MVHTWHTHHSQIIVLNKDTNNAHILNPKVFTQTIRWSYHADMVYQFAHCIKDKYRTKFNQTNIEIYMNYWRSFNGRFNQRQFDSNVDILKARWNPFENTQWIVPLMEDFTILREKIKEITHMISAKYDPNHYNLTFVADLKGLKLESQTENHINSSIEVINGKIIVEIHNKLERSDKNRKIAMKNYSLNVGDKLMVTFNFTYYLT